MTAFLHGQSKIFLKYSFFPKKGIQRTNILRLSNSKAQSKVKRHLLTSLKLDVIKVNDITKREPHDGNGNATLMAPGAYQDIMLTIMLQSCFTVNNKV